MGDYFDLIVEGITTNAQNGKASLQDVQVKQVSKTKLVQTLLEDPELRAVVLDTLQNTELYEIWKNQFPAFVEFAGRAGLWNQETRRALVRYAKLEVPLMRKAIIEIQRCRDSVLASLGHPYFLLTKEDYEILKTNSDEAIVRVYESQYYEHTHGHVYLSTWPWCELEQPHCKGAYCTQCSFKQRHGECHRDASDLHKQVKLFGHIRDIAQIFKQDSRWEKVWGLCDWLPFVEQVKQIYQETQELLGDEFEER